MIAATEQTVGSDIATTDGVADEEVVEGHRRHETNVVEPWGSDGMPRHAGFLPC